MRIGGEEDLGDGKGETYNCVHIRGGTNCIGEDGGGVVVGDGELAPAAACAEEDDAAAAKTMDEEAAAAIIDEDEALAIAAREEDATAAAADADAEEDEAIAGARLAISPPTRLAAFDAPASEPPVVVLEETMVLKVDPKDCTVLPVVELDAELGCAQVSSSLSSSPSLFCTVSGQ